MEIAALCLSLLALLASGAGIALADRRSREATRVAQEALSQSKQTESITYWNAAQEAVQHLVGFDPVSEPVKDRLVNLRVALIALVDHLDGWEGFDRWLEI